MKQRAGLTMIELLLAMALFTFMLMIITAGFLNVVKLQQAGIGARNTQQNTRFGMEELVRSIRSAAEGKVALAGGPGVDGRLCLAYEGGVNQFYVNPTEQRLYRINMPRSTYDASGCVAVPATGAEPVSSSDVLVLRFEPVYLNPVAPGDPPSVRVLLRIGTRSSTFVNSNTQCDQTITGAQFCSITTLSSSATMRGVQAR